MQVKFSAPNSSSNTVSVFRVLPDNSSEIIGEIHTDSITDEDSPIYISTNSQGEELMPPTSNFNEVEERFIEYAKQLSLQEFMQAMIEEADRIHERKATIKTIRRTKVLDGLSKQII